jgi:hypothetical protein
MYLLFFSGETQIDFGRTAAVNCPVIRSDQEETLTAWDIPGISGQDTKLFNARIGPTGGKKGYEGITGKGIGLLNKNYRLCLTFCFEK